MSDMDLIALTGQVEGQGNYTKSEFFPNLKINGDPDNGPTGHFFINGMEPLEYFPTALFRPYVAKLQYMRYDNKENKITGKSVNVNSMKEEAIDTFGGTKCGKLTKKQQAGLDANALLDQKNIKVVRKLYGTVSLLNKKGDTALVDVPVVWQPSGSAFIMVDEVINTVTNKKHLLPQFNWVMTTEKKKNGGVIYFIPVISPDFNNGLKIDDNVIAQLKKFNESINSENDYVTFMWNRANKGNSAVAQKTIDVAKELGFPDDDVSDLGAAKAS